MNGTRLILSFAALALLSTSGAGAGDVTDRMWFGGGLGAGFGDVDFVTLEPVVGYAISPSFFGQVEYEYLNYEFRRFDGSKGRDQFDSLRAGPGYWQSLGERTSLYALALYNFNYDDDNSPYDDPWVYRVGVAVGF